MGLIRGSDGLTRSRQGFFSQYRFCGGSWWPWWRKSAGGLWRRRVAGMALVNGPACPALNSIIIKIAQPQTHHRSYFISASHSPFVPPQSRPFFTSTASLPRSTCFIINQMTNISNLNLSKGTIPPLLKYKIVFLGDQAVGKSSIINRFIYDIFDGNEHRPTIGIDFISQNIFLEDKTIRLQLWDTAGQERFKALIPNYIRDTSVAIIVYDVTNRQSFKSVQKWIDDVKNQRGDGVIIAVLANKVDLEERDVTQAEGKELTERNSVAFKEVSAKTGANIQEFFKEVAAQLPEVNEPTARPKPSPVEAPLSTVSKQEALKASNEDNIVLGKKGQGGNGKEGRKTCC